MAVVAPIVYDCLSAILGTSSIDFTVLNGGSINNAFQLTTTKQRFFCKMNSATKFPHLFEREAKGLSFLEKQGIFKTPRVIQVAEAGSYQLLLLEWIDNATPAPAFWKSFGAQLAALHTITQKHFGLDIDNYMGAVPQTNTPSAEWSSFFIDQRLSPLVAKCYSLQYLTARHVTQFHYLYTHIPAIFNLEPPSLLHGDLWSGNYLCAKDQQPTLIDPAIYFGHRSMDLGMTTLFGGFDKTFYEAYTYHCPLPTNFREQWEVSNLYPLLIHLLLFGKSYLPSIERTLNDFQ
ncbi:MAG TPA: fructosamine kinase family protein [Flavisolibacter sp.]|nr:fructosamine kinase family protein [Flavisolibacter sp.]